MGIVRGSEISVSLGLVVMSMLFLSWESSVLFPVSSNQICSCWLQVYLSGEHWQLLVFTIVLSIGLKFDEILIFSFPRGAVLGLRKIPLNLAWVVSKEVYWQKEFLIGWRC